MRPTSGIATCSQLRDVDFRDRCADLPPFGRAAGAGDDDLLQFDRAPERRRSTVTVSLLLIVIGRVSGR
jgi:hypothetical protein